jgi:hypothetical protein
VLHHIFELAPRERHEVLRQSLWGEQPEVAQPAEVDVVTFERGDGEKVDVPKPDWWPRSDDEVTTLNQVAAMQLRGGIK